ncbi:MAG: phosphotransferase [Chloroflexota bacterium]
MKPFETLTKRGQLSRLKQLGLNALKAYEIDEPHFTPLRHEDNTTFRLQTDRGEQYVLRIHRHPKKTSEMVRSEMMWLDALHQEDGLIVPEPLPTRDGDLLTSASADGVPESRVCVLFRWVPGRFFDDSLRPVHLTRVGAFMARLQQFGATFDPPEGFVRGRLDHLCGKPDGISDSLARQQVDNPEDEAVAIQLVSDVFSPEEGALISAYIEQVRAAQRSIGYGADVFGLIHGDLHQENYLFHQGQVRAIDFDDCGYGHYLYDMAVTLNNVHWRDDAPELRQAFLDGYRSVRPLSAEHEAHLDLLIYLREIQIMLWEIEMRNHPAFRDTWESDAKEVLDDVRKLVA